MPLDTPQKIAHVTAVRNRALAGRTKTVVFVFSNGDGTYRYSATNVIFRPQDAIDPQVPDASGGAPRFQADMIMIAPLATSFVGVVYVADTTSATSGAVAAATKYEVIEQVPAGILPGGTHIRALLRRLR